jgi:hypothetical protein
MLAKRWVGHVPLSCIGPYRKHLTIWSLHSVVSMVAMAVKVMCSIFIGQWFPHFLKMRTLYFKVKQFHGCPCSSWCTIRICWLRKCVRICDNGKTHYEFSSVFKWIFSFIKHNGICIHLKNCNTHVWDIIYSVYTRHVCLSIILKHLMRQLVLPG